MLLTYDLHLVLFLLISNMYNFSSQLKDTLVSIEKQSYTTEYNILLSFKMNSNLTYFSLIQKVGDQGCYQFLVYGLVAMIWFLFGISSISIVFMFLNPGFDCTSLGVSKLECENYVCSHFQGAQRSQYLAEKEMESLVTEFGPFHCENNYLINFFKALELSS